MNLQQAIFLKVWLSGTGRTMEWLAGTGMSPWVQYGTALVCAAVMAAAISCVTQLTGEQTAMRGIKVALLLWLGLLGMMMMGAIVGGWKKKGTAVDASSQTDKKVEPVHS